MEEIQPAHQESLEEAGAQVRAILETKQEERQFHRFVALLHQRYAAKTKCVAPFEAPECGQVVDSAEEL